MPLISGISSGKKQFCKSFCISVLEDGYCKHHACITGSVEVDFLCSLAVHSL